MVLCQGHAAREQTGAQRRGVTESSCSLRDGYWPTVAALLRVLVERESLGEQGCPEQFLERPAGPGVTVRMYPGLGAHLTDSKSRAGLGLMGGQFGSEDDTRSAMTGPSRDKAHKQHVQHSQAKPCPM